MESEGDMTPKELCQFIMDTIMKNAELITLKSGEDDGIEKRIFPKRERRLKRKLEALDLILKMEGWD